MIIPSPHQPRVVIYDGMVSEIRHERADGLTLETLDPPRRGFFVDYIDEDGDHLGVWDGSSYSAAIAAAEEWRRDGVIVDDRVSDEGGAA